MIDTGPLHAAYAQPMQRVAASLDPRNGMFTRAIVERASPAIQEDVRKFFQGDHDAARRLSSHTNKAPYPVDVLHDLGSDDVTLAVAVIHACMVRVDSDCVKILLQGSFQKARARLQMLALRMGTNLRSVFDYAYSKLLPPEGQIRLYRGGAGKFEDNVSGEGWMKHGMAAFFTQDIEYAAKYAIARAAEKGSDFPPMIVQADVDGKDAYDLLPEGTGSDEYAVFRAVPVAMPLSGVEILDMTKRWFHRATPSIAPIWEIPDFFERVPSCAYPAIIARAA